MAGAVAAAAAAVIGGGALTTAVVSIALSVGLQYAISEFSSKPSQSGFTQSGRALAFRSEAAPRAIILGTSQASGAPTFARVGNVSDTPLFTGEEGRVLHLCIPLAGHPVDAIPRVWFGETELETDVDGNVLGPFTGHMAIKKHLGEHDQEADPDLLAAFPHLDANFRGRNIAYLYIAMRRSQNVFPQGLLNFAAEVRGAKVFDPRDVTQIVTDLSTYKWDENAELGITHYMRGVPMRDKDGNTIRPYGLALPDDRFGGFVNVAAEATICDEAIPLKAGGTEKRYTLNGVISTEARPRDELPRLMSSMAGRLVHQPKNWSVRAGVARAPVEDWDRTTLRGDGLVTQPSRSTSTLFTEVQGRYIDGTTYKEGTYPLMSVPDFESTTFGAVRRPVDFPYTNSATMCQRLAKIVILQANKQASVKARVAYRNIVYANADWVNWTDPLRGWTDLPMELGTFTLATYPSADNSEGVAYGVEVEMQETGADVFAWNPIEEEGTIHIGQPSSLPDALNVPAPVSLTAEVIDFDTSAIVELTAGISQSDFDYSYRFSRKLQGEVAFSRFSDQKSNVRVEQNIPPGLHTFRVQAVSHLGRVSTPRDRELQVGAPPLIETVSLLELQGQGSGTEFTGPDASFMWQRGSVNAPGLNDPNGADVYGGDKYFRGYHVRIYGGEFTGTESDPVVLRGTTVPSEGYTYFLDYNRQDAKRRGLTDPQRQFTIEVQQVGEYAQEEQYSDPVYLTVSNPAPPAITGLSVVRGPGITWANFKRLADGDETRVLARSGSTSTFKPELGEGTLDYDGALTNEVRFTVPNGEERWGAIAVADAFGDTGLNWSPTFEITSKALSAEDMDPAIVAALEAADSIGGEAVFRVDADKRIAGMVIVGGDGNPVNAAFLVDNFFIAAPGEGGEVVPIFVADTETGEIQLNDLVAERIVAKFINTAWLTADVFIGGVLQGKDQPENQINMNTGKLKFVYQA